LTEAAPVQRILTPIGEPSRPPPIAPALRNPAPLGYQPEPSLARAFTAPSQLSRLPGTMISGRCPIGTASNSPSPTSRLISASPGSRFLLQARLQPPLCAACPLGPGVAFQRSARRHVCSSARPLSAQVAP
jgi:hypothetical protein